MQTAAQMADCAQRDLDCGSPCRAAALRELHIYEFMMGDVLLRAKNKKPAKKK